MKYKIFTKILKKLRLIFIRIERKNSLSVQHLVYFLLPFDDGFKPESSTFFVPLAKASSFTSFL